MVITAVALAVALVIMLGELIRSRGNERGLRARGAVEPGGDVYKALAVIYPGMFVLMAVEGALDGSSSAAVFATGIFVFAWAKVLKLWAIESLGPSWSYRVLVVPGAPLVATGPYAWLRHPNYVAVFGEIVGFAFIVHAPFAGLLSFLTFAVLVRKRIAVEEKALGITSPESRTPSPG